MIKVFAMFVYILKGKENVLFITDQYQKKYWAGYIGR
jgi:hypothetical protein